jgi:hypothetical protein
MNYIYGDANVESIEIEVRDSFPAQVTMTARGSLLDACTEIDETTVQRTDGAFHVQITTRCQADQTCLQVLTPFEKTIGLDTTGLPAGAYSVEVNDVSDMFTLEFPFASTSGNRQPYAGPRGRRARVGKRRCLIQ